MRTTHAWQTALILAVAVIPLPAAADEAESLRIGVHVVADAKLAADVLEDAKREAARIYEKIGIALTWHDEPSPAVITIRVVDKAMKEAGPSAMGVAPRSRDGVSSLLFAFYSRIEAYARRHDKPIAQILGHVIAHELGHLLLPHGSHSKSGIMVAAWDRRQVEQIGRGWLSFNTDEAHSIRQRAAKLRQ